MSNSAPSTAPEAPKVAQPKVGDFVRKAVIPPRVRVAGYRGEEVSGVVIDIIPETQQLVLSCYDSMRRVRTEVCEKPDEGLIIVPPDNLTYIEKVTLGLVAIDETTLGSVSNAIRAQYVAVFANEVSSS